MIRKKKKFTKAMISFYVKFFEGLSESVQILAKIHKDYKKEYEKIKEIQTEPTKIYDLLDELDDEDKRKLMDLLLRANILQAKSMKLFDMTPKEKKDFADEIKNYLESFTENLKKKIKRDNET